VCAKTDMVVRSSVRLIVTGGLCWHTRLGAMALRIDLTTGALMPHNALTLMPRADKIRVCSINDRPPKG
jgi:hypothetical protein